MGIKFHQALLAVKHGDVPITPEDVIRACRNDFTPVSLPTKGWIRKYPGQSIGLVRYGIMSQVLPNDICMADQDSLLHQHNMKWMVLLLCDPITQAVLIPKTIRILHA